NDLILGRFLDWLEETDDPRNEGAKLIENTIVIFTSDNGAEKSSNIATGPFRSNKGSSFEGGHRVAFLLSWPCASLGDGDASTPGRTDATPICQVDAYATFAEILELSLPKLNQGEKGAEDSISMLDVWKGERDSRDWPMFAHDHKEAKSDPAVAAMRLEDPVVDGEVVSGQWKIFYDSDLLRAGTTTPTGLYELRSDQMEDKNRISENELKPLVAHLNRVALFHRNVGGHRYASLDSGQRAFFELSGEEEVVVNRSFTAGNVILTIEPSEGELHRNPRGIGASGGRVRQVSDGETLTLRFDQDVIVQHLAIVAGNGQCGGFYQVGENAPLAIYCVDGDVDEKDQSGVLSDIGLVRKGDSLVLSSAPHFGSEAPGQWRLGSVSVRPLP
ncbi:MAG: sulfatase-like hydrolase/transferase, partial [Verrucomicrobiota bacterium]